jgi:hypothetical protein
VQSRLRIFRSVRQRPEPIRNLHPSTANDERTTPSRISASADNLVERQGNRQPFTFSIERFSALAPPPPFVPGGPSGQQNRGRDTDWRISSARDI